MPKVDIGWGQVFQALMVALMVVVLDERLDVGFERTRQRVVFQQGPIGYYIR